MSAILPRFLGSKSQSTATKASLDRTLRETAGRFRVLIIGRANAGKTTILQKVCKTAENPDIFDAEGHKV
jgi:50S ribosomal subunit-associated GTPase HflX